MKWTVLLVSLLVSVVEACKPGYKSTDVPGVCVEINQTETNPSWVSNEKPPKDKMPSWQREGITVIDAPAMTTADEKEDLDKLNADKEGKRAAGLR